MKKSVKSENPCQSVIQTFYDIVKAHGGDIKVETKLARAFADGEGEAHADDPIGRGTTFTIELPITKN